MGSSGHVVTGRRLHVFVVPAVLLGEAANLCVVGIGEVRPFLSNLSRSYYLSTSHQEGK